LKEGEFFSSSKKEHGTDDSGTTPKKEGRVNGGAKGYD